MKAPDKIYVKEFDKGISQMWSSIKATETTDNAQHEYIRKEALLEWAKECFRLQDEGSWYSKGAADAFSRVIDKLNSI